MVIFVRGFLYIRLNGSIFSAKFIGGLERNTTNITPPKFSKLRTSSLSGDITSDFFLSIRKILDFSDF